MNKQQLNNLLNAIYERDVPPKEDLIDLATTFNTSTKQLLELDHVELRALNKLVKTAKQTLTDKELNNALHCLSELNNMKQVSNIVKDNAKLRTPFGTKVAAEMFSDICDTNNTVKNAIITQSEQLFDEITTGTATDEQVVVA